MTLSKQDCNVIKGRFTSAFFGRSRRKLKQTRQKKGRSSRKMQSKGHRQFPEDFQSAGLSIDVTSSLLQDRIQVFPYNKAFWTQLSQSLQQLEAWPNAKTGEREVKTKARTAQRVVRCYFRVMSTDTKMLPRSSFAAYWISVNWSCLELEISWKARQY